MAEANQHHSSAQQVIAATVARLVEISFPQDMSSMAGPIPSSNWVIKGMILAGDCPRGAKLSKLLSVGVEHFIDLRAVAENYLQGREGEVDPSSRLQYTNFDLQSRISSVSSAAVTETALMVRGVVADCILNNRVAYFHCTDGHSLTGVAMCGVLSAVYGVSGLKATAIASQLHGARRENEGVHQLLSTAAQKAFVRSLSADASQFPIGAFAPSRSTSFTSSRGGSPTQNVGPFPPPIASSGSLPRPPSVSQLSGSALVDSATSSQSGGNSPARGFGNGAANQSQRQLGASRFEHTRGHGGGYTSLNLFGGDQPTTPPKRSGRAAVPGMSPDYHHKVATAAHIDPNAVQTTAAPRAAQPYVPEAGSPRDDGSTRGETEDRQGAFKDRRQPSPGPIGQSPPNSFRRQLPPSAEGSPRSADGRSHAAEGDAEPMLPRRDSYGLCDGAMQLPPYRLPPPLDPKREPECVRGPTPKTNWCVRDQVLVGPEPQAGQRDFHLLVQQRFDVFVCLTEGDTSAGYLTAYRQISQHPASSIHFPLVDGQLLSPGEFGRFYGFAAQLAALVRRGAKLYIHCSRGHGRTGMVVCVLLAVLYSLPGMKAVNLCDALHDCRGETDGASSPEQEQRTSVLALLANVPGGAP